MAQSPDSAGEKAAAYREGRSAGLAIGALSMAALAYINLLSLEKSLLAIVLASLALSRAGASAAETRRRAFWAVGISVAHVLIWAAAVLWVLVWHYNELAQLLAKLWLHHG